MSSSTIDLGLNDIGHKITVYGGIIVLIVGVIGGFFNIIVFLSLKTFRRNSCAFYLTIMSLVNICQLLFGLLSRVMITGYGIDWTTMSLPFCKFRWTFFIVTALISYTCLCLATLDQYFATCTRTRWQKWSNIKLAHYLMLISTVICIALSIPYAIYATHIVSRSSGKVSCGTTNIIMTRYSSLGIALGLSGYVPDVFTVFFGILAYRNIQHIAYRTVPLVRRELDKQLTIMVLVQVVINFFTNIPCVTLNSLLFALQVFKDPISSQRAQFAYTTSVIIFYSYFAASFYIYICVSERFRRQFFYVLFEIHFNRWRQHGRIFMNQIVPNISQ